MERNVLLTSTRRQWISGTAIALSWVAVSSLRAAGSQMLRGWSSLKVDRLGFKNPNAWVTAETKMRNPWKDYRCLSGMRLQMHRSPHEDDPEVTTMPRCLKRAARRRCIEWVYLRTGVEDNLYMICTCVLEGFLMIQDLLCIWCFAIEKL